MIISSAEPLVPIFVFLLHQLKATVIFERISLAQLVLQKVFAPKILFIVKEINLETSGWGKIRLAVLLHEVLVVFTGKAENETGIKRAVNRFLWDCCDRTKEIKAFMTETPKCDCQKKHFSEHNLYFIKKSLLVNSFQK